MSDRALVVSIHALDTGAGDGLIADASVFDELGCDIASVATSALVPEPLPLDIVSRQLERVLRLGPLGAVRVGFVHGAPQVETIAHFLRRSAPGNSVFAPALRSGTEDLADAETRSSMVRHLYPAARVVVARAAELELLTGQDVDDLPGLRDASLRLQEQGARAVLISGLFLRGRVIDLLADGSDITVFDTARVQAPHVAGLSGAYAAALAGHVARGLSLRDAAESAQRYVGFRIQRGR